MKIGYMSIDGISDPKKASGTPFFVAKAIGDTLGTVCDISPDTKMLESRWSRLKENPEYALEKLACRLRGRSYPPHIYNTRYQKIWAAKIEKTLKTVKPDIVFADKCSSYFPYLETDVPIFYRTDSTFVLMNGYYPEFSNFDAHIERSAHIAESAAFDKCRYFVPISQWAANSAISDYNLKKDKCLVVRTHASLSNEQRSNSKSLPVNGTELRFLFIGANWARKGGDLAVATIKHLRARGIDAQLHVLCKNVPQEITSHSFVKKLSFIDRSTPEGNAEYFKLFDQAHFFFMPTIAECMGQVFIDALMHGLPSIALDTGAVGEVVVNGETGLLLPMTTVADEVSDAVATLLSTPEHYSQLSKNSIEYYWREFSLDVFKQRMTSLIQTINPNLLKSAP